MKHYMKLRGRIIEKYGTYSRFAESLKITNTMLSARLNKKTMITVEEAYRWSKELDIDSCDIGNYFFD